MSKKIKNKECEPLKLRNRILSITIDLFIVILIRILYFNLQFPDKNSIENKIKEIYQSIGLQQSDIDGLKDFFPGLNEMITDQIIFYIKYIPTINEIYFLIFFFLIFQITTKGYTPGLLVAKGKIRAENKNFKLMVLHRMFWSIISIIGMFGITIFPLKENFSKSIVDEKSKTKICKA